MAICASANNQDPTLFCAYFGGPRDGWKTGDLPAELSGLNLEGTVTRIPLSQPAVYSLYAIYECMGAAQVDGYWQFFFRGMAGPNGELLVDAATPDLDEWTAAVPDSLRGLDEPEGVTSGA